MIALRSKPLEGAWVSHYLTLKQRMYKRWCAANTTTQAKARNIRNALLKEGYLIPKATCETVNCGNPADEIHEMQYTFDALFNASNYQWLCSECHREWHKNRREREKRPKR